MADTYPRDFTLPRRDPHDHNGTRCACGRPLDSSARVAELEADVKSTRRERNKTAAYTLGGYVEGAPTTEFNWLQRARALVAFEVEARARVAELEAENKWRASSLRELAAQRDSLQTIVCDEHAKGRREAFEEAAAGVQEFLDAHPHHGNVRKALRRACAIIRAKAYGLAKAKEASDGE